MQGNLAILAFDPGYTTGVCLAECVDFAARSFTITLSQEVKWENRRNIYTALAKLKEEEDQGRLYLTAIIVENFRLFAKHAMDQVGSDFPAVKVLERVIAYAELLELEDRIVIQEPFVKGGVKFLPEHFPLLLPKSEHARDAYQLLRYYVLMHKSRVRRKPKG